LKAVLDEGSDSSKKCGLNEILGYVEREMLKLGKPLREDASWSKQAISKTSSTLLGRFRFD
jgi:hypothetical protein